MVLDFCEQAKALRLDLSAEDFTDERQDFVRVEGQHCKVVYSFFYLAHVEQVVDEGLHQGDLCDNHGEVLVRVSNLGRVFQVLHDHLFDRLDKEKDGTKRRSHLMTHRRLEVFRVLVLLELLFELHLVHSCGNLFGDVAHENHRGVFSEVLLLLDLDFDEVILNFFHKLVCILFLLSALQ